MVFVPTILEKTQKWERAFDLYSRMLEDRIIFVQWPVETHMANIIIAQLLFLEKKDPKKDITMYINSPWGSVLDGMGIFDTMEYIQPDITTVCTWLAASMWSMLLVAGTKWKRMMLQNGRVMIHQPSNGMQWKISDNMIMLEEWVKRKKILTQIVADRTWQTYKQVEKDMDRDTWMDAEQSLAYGLVDKIVTRQTKTTTEEIWWKTKSAA